MQLFKSELPCNLSVVGWSNIKINGVDSVSSLAFAFQVNWRDQCVQTCQPTRATRKCFFGFYPGSSSTALSVPLSGNYNKTYTLVTKMIIFNTTNKPKCLRKLPFLIISVFPVCSEFFHVDLSPRLFSL